MSQLLKPVLVIGLLLTWIPSGQAQEDSRAIIEKAIRAQGSALKEKFKATRIKSKGTAYQLGMEFQYTDDEIYQEFDRIKSVHELKFDGQTISVTLGFDGQKAWMKAGEALAGLDESELNLTAYVINELYLMRVTGLTSLLKFHLKPEDAKNTDEQKSASLIRLLGDKNFAVREKASQDLIGLGNAAVPSLEKAQKSSDLEVARRAERCLSIICSKDIYFDLSPLPEIKVEGKPAKGVRVRSRGHKDINLYFDKDSGLMVKLTRRFDDPMPGEQIDEERIIKEWLDIQGAKAAKKASIYRNGKKYIDSELVEAKRLEKIDDREFVKP
jgi:hypothetical protein